MGYPISLQDRAEECHQNSVRHGFWYNEDGSIMSADDPMVVAAKLCLIHSEVSEALEAIRVQQHHYYLSGPDEKPEGLLSELADVVIRAFDLAEALRRQGFCKTTIEQAISDKMVYNESRPMKHGKAV